MNDTTIIVNTKTGTDDWVPGEWDEYVYDSDIFVIKLDGYPVAIYNMNNVLSIMWDTEDAEFYD